MTLTVDLGEIEIDINESTGRIDAVIVDGEDFVDNKTVEEFIIALLGSGERFNQIIAENQSKKIEKDRREDEYGVSV